MVNKGEEKALEVIRILLKQKIDYNVIANATGKTIEDIKKIEKKYINNKESYLFVTLFIISLIFTNIFIIRYKYLFIIKS